MIFEKMETVDDAVDFCRGGALVTAVHLADRRVTKLDLPFTVPVGALEIGLCKGTLCALFKWKEVVGALEVESFLCPFTTCFRREV